MRPKFTVTAVSVLISVFLFVLFSSYADSGTDPEVPDIHFLPQISNPYIEYESGSEMLVNLGIRGEDFAPEIRPPVNLVLVIDESGSMSEHGKMTYARQAAKDMIKKLNSRDRVGIVTYSDYSKVVFPMQWLGNRSIVLRMIDSIHPTNSTNLSAGLIEGISQLKYGERNGYINKVILLSDGLANRGITDIGSLSGISGRAARDGIYITTMGLGVSYDEDLMMNIAEYGAGNYYYIESPDQMAYIFDKEFRQTTSTVATDLVIELELGRDVGLLEVYGYTYSREGRSVRFNLGNIHSGQERNIRMRLKVPDEKEGEYPLMSSVLTYRDVKDNKEKKRDKKIAYYVTKSKKKVEKNMNKQVIAEVSSAEAAKTLDEATRYYESGDRDSALSNIKKAVGAIKQLNRTPYRSPKTVEQEEALNNALRSMSAQPSADSADGKGLIKKFKAESREQLK